MRGFAAFGVTVAAWMVVTWVRRATRCGRCIAPGEDPDANVYDEGAAAERGDECSSNPYDLPPACEPG